MNGWIGVDLDGTLAYYDEWRGPQYIGEPIPAMYKRVKIWLDEGRDVRIFTARVSQYNPTRLEAFYAINEWCMKHFGRVLPVTSEKDYGMIELWDDRCVQVIPNKGIALQELFLEVHHENTRQTNK
jgi:hypothetical protein